MWCPALSPLFILTEGQMNHLMAFLAAVQKENHSHISTGGIKLNRSNWIYIYVLSLHFYFFFSYTHDIT